MKRFLVAMSASLALVGLFGVGAGQASAQSSPQPSPMSDCVIMHFEVCSALGCRVVPVLVCFPDDVLPALTDPEPVSSTIE